MVSHKVTVRGHDVFASADRLQHNRLRWIGFSAYQLDNDIDPIIGQHWEVVGTEQPTRLLDIAEPIRLSHKDVNHLDPNVKRLVNQLNQRPCHFPKAGNANSDNRIQDST
jgi:hypothetical protein